MITDYRDIKVGYIYSVKETTKSRVTKKENDIDPIDELALVESVLDNSDGEDFNCLIARTVYSVHHLNKDELEWETTAESWIDDYIIELIGHRDDYPEYFL